MDTLKFFQRVLPSTGFYVSATIGSDGKTQQGFFPTLEELAESVTKLNARGNNTYYALSAYKEKGNRKQDNVRAIKVVALDIDCGENKPYPSWKEGLIDLDKFITGLRLPKPLIVFSGNGLHVYWTLQNELSVDEWKPIANAMKIAAVDKQFHIDPVVTSDSARILRPVGTTNPKSGKEVKVLIEGVITTPEDLKTALIQYYKPTSTVQRNSGLLDSLAVKHEYPPSSAEVVASKCQQVQWAITNQADVPEPIWYDLIGIAAHCNDAEAVAISWSKDHPTYDETKTLQKLHQWQSKATGPTTCTKFELDNPGGCKGCKYKGMIGTPARLGTQYTEVSVSQDAPDLSASIVPLPQPFVRTNDGIKFMIDGTPIDVCKFDVYPVGYGKDESLGYETVRFHWDRPHVGWKELSLRQAYLTDSNREFPTAIADQGIVLTSKRQTEYFQMLLRNYMEELRQIRSMTNLYASMGWKENYTQFIIGNKLLKRNANGSVSEEAITLASASQKINDELYGQSGTVQSWSDFSRLLESADMRAHMFTLGIGFSAPLFAFTGLKGIVVSLYGPTGGGKSLAQYWQQSIYGDPEKLHFSAKSTQNTMFSRLGLYCHLPMTIDEFTMTADKDVGDFCYWVTQGKDKARLNRNAEERDAKQWATPVTISTNRSLQSKLVASGLDSDAQMARLLEITIEPHALFTETTEAGRKIYDFVTTNYGVVGQTYIKKLMEIGEVGIRAMIDEATATFKQRYNATFAGDERFWEQAVVLADLGSRLASEWGLIQYDYKKGTEFALKQLGAIRTNATSSKLDAFDLLSEYLNTYSDKMVTIMHTFGQNPTPDYNRMPRADIRGHFDVYRPTSSAKFDKGILMVDKKHFTDWISSRGNDWNTFYQALKFENVNATPKSGKFCLGKHTGIRTGQCYVFGVNLSHPRLQGLLDDADEAVDNLTLGQVAVVK